ncbi:MAG: hypothetical protein K0S65_1741, partial [Labilithrix sp.]|nr:hypothetical protein [Labilithrix sp.]
PAIDSAEETEEAPPATPSVQDPSWTGAGESPKLVEARAKMMAMLGGQPNDAPAPSSMQEGWAASDVPEKPSALEWPEPPPIAAPTVSEQPKPPAPPPLPKKGPAATGRSSIRKAASFTDSRGARGSMSRSR